MEITNTGAVIFSSNQMAYRDLDKSKNMDSSNVRTSQVNEYTNAGYENAENMNAETAPENEELPSKEEKNYRVDIETTVVPSEEKMPITNFIEVKPDGKLEEYKDSYETVEILPPAYTARPNTANNGRMYDPTFNFSELQADDFVQPPSVVTPSHVLEENNDLYQNTLSTHSLRDVTDNSHRFIPGDMDTSPRFAARNSFQHSTSLDRSFGSDLSDSLSSSTNQMLRREAKPTSPKVVTVGEVNGNSQC